MDQRGCNSLLPLLSNLFHHDLVRGNICFIYILIDILDFLIRPPAARGGGGVSLCNFVYCMQRSEIRKSCALRQRWEFVYSPQHQNKSKHYIGFPYSGYSRPVIQPDTIAN